MTFATANVQTPWSRGDVLSLVGLIVTVVGFSVAVWQLVRAANASVATRDTIATMSRAQLLLLLPQFRVLETELDWAISLKVEGRDLAIRVLTSYVHLAHEVAGMMSAHDLGSAEVEESLRRSAELAAQAKNKVYASKASVSTITEDLRTAMQQIGGQLSKLGAAEQSHIAMKGHP